MMIGARTAAWAKSGGWVNPYVTDGLVAMWDGEWNAGGGVHESRAMLTDLVSGIQNIYNNPDYTMDDNCIVYDVSTTGQTFGAFFPISELTSQSILTYECVAWFANLKRWGAIYAFTTPNCTLSGEHGSIRFGGLEYSGFPSYINRKYINRQNQDSIFSISGTMKNEPWNGSGSRYLHYRYNGTEFYNEVLGGVYADVGVDGGINILGSNDSGSSTYPPTGLFAKLYNLRVYDRVLTPAETAANYAIDKARFNLT